MVKKMKKDRLILDRKKISNIIITLSLILPFIKYYDFPGIGISLETFVKIIIFFFSILLIRITRKDLKDKRLKKSSFYFKVFCVWFMAITIFYEVFTNININNPNANYTYNILIMLIPTMISLSVILDGCLCFDEFYKKYEKFVSFVVLIYIIQWILVIFGKTISFKLPFFNYSDSYSYLEPYIFGMNFQPTSLFSEKAHLCEFLLPFVIICQYDNKIKHNIIKSVLISIIIISTMSGNGIVALLITWLSYFILFGKIRKVYRFLIILILPFFILILYNFLLRIPTFNRMSKELFINTTGKYTQTKADYRVYRGFDYYFKLTNLEKATGVGYSHMQIYSKEKNITSKYDNPNAGFEFFSTITQVLLYSGIIGFILFVIHLYELWKSNSRLVKGLLIMIVAIWFSSQMLFSEIYYIYIMLIVSAFVSSVKHEKKL